MKHIHRQELIARLDAIFDPGNPAAPQSAQVRQQAIADALDSANLHDIDSETRCVTILLSDLRGFTGIAENFSAMDMVAALNRYLSRMVEIILRHHGSIDKFMGDAIMALFGAPDPLANDIEAALACAIEMQIAMDEVNAENKLHGMATLYMGIGINTGDVVVGHLGSKLHSEYTAIGDPVTLVSRVEAHSLRGQILLGESTYLQAKDFIEIGDINEVQIKGKKGSVRMVELLALRGLHPIVAPKREIRDSRRVEVDMPLFYQILRGKLVLPEKHIGRIVDLSYGGMLVISPVGLSPFDDIKVALSLDLAGHQLTEIYAKVLRVTKVNGEYRCPVEFTSIETEAAQTIKEFVDSIVEFNRH